MKKKSVASDQLQFLDSTGRLVQDLTTTQQSSEPEAQWIDGSASFTQQRANYGGHGSYEYGAPQYAHVDNMKWSSQMSDLEAKKRKTREAYEAKRAKEAGGAANASKRVRAGGGDSGKGGLVGLYATNQPNVTEATDELHGERGNGDFTNPCLAQFDLYAEKGGAGSSSMYVFCYTIVLPSFLVCDSVSLLPIYYRLLALSDTTRRLTITPLPQSIINRPQYSLTDYLTGTRKR
jgi:hypothetical protein